MALWRKLTLDGNRIVNSSNLTQSLAEEMPSAGKIWSPILSLKTGYILSNFVNSEAKAQPGTKARKEKIKCILLNAKSREMVK